MINYGPPRQFLNYEQLNMVASSNVSLTNNNSTAVTAFKTSGASGWDAQAYCMTPFTAPCTLEFSKMSLDYNNLLSAAMIGWNIDPQSNPSYNTIDYASYPWNVSSYEVYHNGSQVQIGGVWDPKKRFYIVYDTDGYIRHYNGSTLLYSANYGTGNTLYIDSSIEYVDSSSTYSGFTNIRAIRKSWNGSAYI